MTNNPILLSSCIWLIFICFIQFSGIKSSHPKNQLKTLKRNSRNSTSFWTFFCAAGLEWCHHCHELTNKIQSIGDLSPLIIWSFRDTGYFCTSTRYARWQVPESQIKQTNKKQHQEKTPQVYELYFVLLVLNGRRVVVITINFHRKFKATGGAIGHFMNFISSLSLAASLIT